MECDCFDKFLGGGRLVTAITAICWLEQWLVTRGCLQRIMNSFYSRFDTREFRSVIDDIMNSTKTDGELHIKGYQKGNTCYARERANTKQPF